MTPEKTNMLITHPMCAVITCAYIATHGEFCGIHRHSAQPAPEPAQAQEEPEVLDDTRVTIPAETVWAFRRYGTPIAASSRPAETVPAPTLRCEGRYPVPHQRDEPFEVTYRCGLTKGHSGPCADIGCDLSAESKTIGRDLSDSQPPQADTGTLEARIEDWLEIERLRFPHKYSGDDLHPEDMGLILHGRDLLRDALAALLKLRDEVRWNRANADSALASLEEMTRLRNADFARAGEAELKLMIKASQDGTPITALVREFVDYWTGQNIGRRSRVGGDATVGCGMCGGIPHSIACFVGRLEAALRTPKEKA